MEWNEINSLGDHPKNLILSSFFNEINLFLHILRWLSHLKHERKLNSIWKFNWIWIKEKKVWRSTLWINLIGGESSTNYKLKRKKKRGKEWRMWGIFKAQNAEGAKCSKCAAWSALFITKQTVITSKLFHHFAKISSLFDAMRDLDDASSR